MVSNGNASWSAVSGESPAFADCSSDQIFRNVREGQVLGIESSVILVVLNWLV